MIGRMSDDPTKSAAQGTIEAIYKPIESIVKTLAGPAAEEIGLSFRDSVQVWRFKRQIRLFERVKQICNEAGMQPKAVKLPLLFEIVDKASLEEDDDLQDRWANLLANAADPKQDVLVLTAFPDILRQISKEEALFLEDMSLRRMKSRPAEEWATLAGRAILTSEPVTVAPVYEDNLRRLGLIEETDAPFSRVALGPFGKDKRTWQLTELGLKFVRACKGRQADESFNN
jgi:hypothetical protein